MYKPSHLIITLAILAVLIPMTAAMIQIDCTPTTSTEAVVTIEKPDYTDDTKYRNFYGRLCIPDVGIDVALYREQVKTQQVTDRKDSACYFRMNNGGWIIADHNTQGFKTLIDVVVGTEAIIVLRNGETKSLVCVEVLDGINTGHGIVDNSRKVQHGRYDLLMYTCLTERKGVRICQWDYQE